MVKVFVLWYEHTLFGGEGVNSGIAGVYSSEANALKAARKFSKSPLGYELDE